MGKYYVYAAYGVREELLYIGKGCGSRWKHCIYGASSSTDINRYFFQNGEIGSINVKMLKYFDKEDDALKFELHSIATLNPAFNKNFNNPVVIKTKNLTDLDRLTLGLSVDYSRLMKQYIKAIEGDDEDVIKMISEYSEEHKRHVDVLGVDKIKAIGINKTKVSNAYYLKLKFNESTFIIKENLRGIAIGNKYTLVEINSLLKVAYEKAGINKPPKSTDIKNFFSVKDVFISVDGKRSKGYLILEDLYKDNI